MSSENQAITDVKPESPALEVPSQEHLNNVKAEKAQLKALLAEARNTRQLMTDFKAAIHTAGSFPGHAMLPVAKGLAFLDAILEQNKAPYQKP